MIYGDSYNDLTRGDQNYDAARDQRYFQLLADLRGRERAAQAASEHQDAMELAFRQLAQQGLENNANRQVQLLTQGADQDYRNRALGQNANLFQNQLDQGMKIAQMNLDAQNRVHNASDADKLYNEAFQAIGQNTIQTPEQLDTFVGDQLPPDYKSRLGAWLNEAQTKRTAGYDAGNRAAEVLNAEWARRIAPFQSQYDAAQAKLPSTVPEKHWYWPSTWGHEQFSDVQNSVPVMQYNQARTKFFEDLAKNKSYQGLADFDPTAAPGGKFVNVVPRPASIPQMQGPPAPLSPSAGAEIPPTSSPIEVPSSQWKELPQLGLKVHPLIYQSIVKQASAFKTEADKSAYLQRAWQDALRSGTAQPIVSPGQAVDERRAKSKRDAQSTLNFITFGGVPAPQ